MSTIEWSRDDKADWGTVDGQRRYGIAGGCLWFCEDQGDWWCLIGLSADAQTLAEAHWAGLQDRKVADAINTVRDAAARLTESPSPIRLESDEAAKLYAAIDALPPPPVAPPPTRRTLLVNGVYLTGDVRSISTHTHGDGTQSIDISFVPDSADDTVCAIESMRVDR